MSDTKFEYVLSVKDELDKCTKCATCLAGCPTYELTESETLAARGKIRLAQALIDGQIDLTDRVKNDFTQCLSCMNCLQACPSGVDTMAVFEAVRHEIAERDGIGTFTRLIFKHVLPYPGRLNLLAKLVGLASLFYTYAPNVFSSLFPYSPMGVKRVTPDFLQPNLRSVIGEINPTGAVSTPLRRVAFFTGCMTDLAFPKTGKHVVELLNKAGIEVVFPTGQLCCGAPAYFNGDVETAKILARHNLDVLSALDVDAIVYSCATCGSVLGETYPHILPDDPRAKAVAEKMVDFQKLVIDQAVASAFAGTEKEGRKLKVTYHDPCHLRRGMGVHQEPRKLIKSLPNVEFVEMEGANSCCGGSGTFAVKYYDMAMEQGKRKVDWIAASGADVVVTACPSCQLQLADALHRHGSTTPVLHTADLIDYVLAGKAPDLRKPEKKA
jgi:glycolate oxidase iron-sulfur subunit